MMDELCEFGSGRTAAMSELAAVCEHGSRQVQHPGYVATWLEGFVLVYVKVSEAGETVGEDIGAAGLLEPYLPPSVGVPGWAAGDKDPIAAAGIVRSQTVGIAALLGQRHSHAVDVWV
jgi:hypothetical protein